MGTDTAQIPYTVNYNNHTSLHNWVEQLDLVCTPSFRLGLLGSMYFAGWTVTILFIPLLADKIGRRWIFFISVVITWAALWGIYLSKSLTMTISMMFLAGAMNSGRVMVGFVFASEFLMPNW